MNHTRSKNLSIQKRFSIACVILVLVLTLLASILPKTSAADLSTRSIRLSSSFAGEVVNHTYAFTTVTPSNVGSIEFEYCTNDPFVGTPCTPPAGLDVSGAGIFSQLGIIGFSVSGASSSNRLIITRAPAAELPTSNTYVFSNILNPSTPDQIVYVRISVYDNINASGTRVDSGAVVFVVDDRFDISAFVPPYMTFCVGVSVAPNCSSTNGFVVTFGELSALNTASATTQFAVATNDPTGYNTFVNGATMTSGNNTITPMLNTTQSIIGTSQFGMNLRANTAPFVGANPDGGGTGAPDPNYNNVNQYRFVDGDRIAGSALSTDFNRYTVSYIVNVPRQQRPGVYAATLTYTAIASF